MGSDPLVKFAFTNRPICHCNIVTYYYRFSLNLCRLLMNAHWRDSIYESIELEYTRERHLTHKDYDDRNHELTESLVAELNERKKIIENDHLNMELCMYIFYNY